MSKKDLEQYYAWINFQRSALKHKSAEISKVGQKISVALVGKKREGERMSIIRSLLSRLVPTQCSPNPSIFAEQTKLVREQLKSLTNEILAFKIWIKEKKGTCELFRL